MKNCNNCISLPVTQEVQKAKEKTDIGHLNHCCTAHMTRLYHNILDRKIIVPCKKCKGDYFEDKNYNH